MSRLVPRLRGVMGIGVTWGVLWVAIGVIIVLVIGYVDPDSIDPGEGPVDVARILGGVGFVSGLVFASILWVAERRSAMADLPLLRAMMWGVVASAALPLLTPMNDATLSTNCPFGAVSALVSVAIARTAGGQRRPSA